MKGEKMPRPTGIPNFLLPTKGWLDARRGEKAVNSYCSKVCCRAAAIEAGEVARTERGTAPIRRSASLCLAEHKRLAQRLTEPAPPPKENTPAATRLRRRDAAEREAAQERLRECEKELISALEELTHLHVLLDGRLRENRERTMEAVSLYLMHVPAAPEIEDMGDTGYKDAYLASHEALDRELSRTVETLRRKETV